MKTPPPPQPPDPEKTATAQAGMNRDTAIAQQQTNMTNQVTPQGTLTYNRLGEDHSYVDSTGKTVSIPRYEAVTAYSPEQQRIYDLGSQTEAKIGEIGLAQAGRIGDLLGSPVNLDNEAVEARLYDLGARRLDPRFAQEEETLRTRLANQGIGAGSAAYNNAMTEFTRAKNDAYNQLVLGGRGQAVQEALARRNQPINEITALLNGSQVSQPNFVNTPQAPVAGVDYIGMKNAQYQAQMQAYGQQLAARSSMLGGIFGLLGQGIRFSDRRLKSNVVHVGTWKNGLNVYAYDIFGRRELGFMADEVAVRFPHAVGESGGWLMVNYQLAMEAA